MKKITLALIAAVLIFTSCETLWDYRVPKEKRQIYSETVNAKGVSDLDFKITLFMWDKGFNYASFTANSLRYIKQKDGESSFEVIGDYLMNNAFCTVRVTTKPDEYRINFEPDYVISAVSLNELNNALSLRDNTWRSFTEDMKQAVLANLSDNEIKQLIQSGYAEYEKGQYDAARKYLIKAAIVDPGNNEALVAYGNCLFMKRLYNDAAVIYSLMPGNPIARENLQLAQKNHSEQVRMAQERQRLAEEERRRQEEASREAALNILNATTQALAIINGGSGNQGGATGGSAGGQQSQSGTSSGSSPSEDRHIANNSASAERTYHNYARAAKGHYDNLEKAKRTDSSSATQSHESRIRELEKNLRDCQKQMRDFREKARQQGVDIRKDYYEDAWPR